MSKVQETYEQQMKDSDMIYNQIISANYNKVEDAQLAIVRFYVPDMTISRAGISHVLKRIEDKFKAGKKQNDG